MRKRVLPAGMAAAFVIFDTYVLREVYKSLCKVAERSFRHGTYYRLFEKWLSLKEEGKTLESFFVENRMHNIAIYGMGMLGGHLVRDLQDSESVVVSYGIDRVVEKAENDIRMYKPEDCLPEADIIVVTAIFSYDEVTAVLKDKVSCPVISLEEIVEDI